MTTFFICRHGQTENNKLEHLSGWLDSPLTEDGVQQALGLAAKLQQIHFDKIISSDLGRAFITAYMISRSLGYTAVIDRFKGLREENYGDLANIAYDAYPKLSMDERTNYTPPGGESLFEMQQRVLVCLKDISQENDNRTILIVAHDGTINAVRASFTKESMGQADATRNAHDFVAKFIWDKDAVTSFSEV